MKKETILPIFPGFYNSIYEPDESSEMERINEQREAAGLEPAKFEDFAFDYREYEKEVGKGVCAYQEKTLRGIGLNCSLEFVEIDSPKEYNFRTDKIVANIKCSWPELRKMWLSLDKDDVQAILNENHKSRSGFISFYPHQYEKWIEYTSKTVDHNVLCTMLECIILLHEDADFDELSMYESVTGNVSLWCTNYSDLIKVSVDIDKWNAKMGYTKYPETIKFFDTDPDIPESQLPYRQGDVVYMEDEKDFGVVIGHIDGYREELRTDLAGMAPFSKIRIADCEDTDEMKKTVYGREILSFLNESNV
jgi:hypothetical protein